MRMIKYPSIEQFKSVIRNVQHKSRYKGKDENGEPFYDNLVKLPTLKFRGTEKLHGTNAAVGYDSSGNIWFQSRENIITPEKDNAGFAMFAHSKLDILRKIFSNLHVAENESIMIYGEWCGGNIQKGVAISGLTKMFVIFDIAFVEEDKRTWFKPRTIEATLNGADSRRNLNANNIYFIEDFKTWEIDIDFNNPHIAQNELIKLTLEIEEESVVGKHFGNEGIGEGIVWKCIEDGYNDSGFWMKVKGEKHAGSSKVKVLAPIDVEKVENLNKLIEKITPEWRLQQILQKTFDTLNGGEINMKGMGNFIKNMMSDILKEELDVISKSGFTTKDLGSGVAKVCREYIGKQL